MKWLILAAIVFFGLVGHGIAQTYFTTGGSGGSGITAYQKAVIAAAGSSLFGGLGT